MPYSTIAPFFNLKTGLGQSVAAGVEYENYYRPARSGRSAPDYYPEKFYEEYFYRDSYKEPVRDFRSYKVKTFAPDRKLKNTEPIRDFRTELWKNKNYR
jgi:hypothetical protein